MTLTTNNFQEMQAERKKRADAWLREECKKLVSDADAEDKMRKTARLCREISTAQHLREIAERIEGPAPIRGAV